METMTSATSQISNKELIEKQRKYIHSGGLRSIEERKRVLQTLRDAIKSYEEAIIEAVAKDMGRPSLEAYASEILYMYNEIDHAIRNISKWAKKKRVSLPWLLIPGRAHLIPQPYGSVLVISPWNYPVQLSLSPIVGAIAAGNAVILKPSEIGGYAEAVLREMINKTFPPELFHVITGDKDVTMNLIHSAPDYICFTGSPAVGKIIMQEAAKNLIPVTLELGGKSPCIVHDDVNMDAIMNRILWGKCFNAGQTCIGIDYVLVQKKVKDAFVSKFIEFKNKAYGEDTIQSPDFGRIINEKNFDRIAGMISGNILSGGKTDRSQKFIDITLIDADENHPAMQEEIFGPLMPILTYDIIEEAINFILKREKPLALYLYSNDKAVQEKVEESTYSGSLAINNTLLQVATTTLPFGGVGNSGMGSYHGKFGFETFSHMKPVLNKSLKLDSDLLYAPYKNTMRKLEKWALWLSR
ncbi:MAG: aldehyde dehydrogenase family protein [Saprospiraceae bacterium]|nr:aldehyde dehydrogenase family protein [Saprospiraceae bacterium]